MSGTDGSPTDRQALVEQLEKTVTSFEDRISMLDDLLATYDPPTTGASKTPNRATRLEGTPPDTAWIQSDATRTLSEWQ
jgi:hypothetical protein